MENERQSLRETITAYRNGEYAKNKTDIVEKVYEFWYDWFCKESSLTNKGLSLLQKINQIADSKKIDADKTYIWFKNCCPCNGTLYDRISISEIESNKVIYCIIPKSGHKCDEGKAFLYSWEDEFEKPIVEGTWKDIKNYFNN